MSHVRGSYAVIVVAIGLTLGLVFGLRPESSPFERVEGLMPREQVYQLLGQPDEVARNVWVYRPNDGRFTEFRIAFGPRDRVAWLAYGRGVFSDR